MSGGHEHGNGGDHGQHGDDATADPRDLVRAAIERLTGRLDDMPLNEQEARRLADMLDTRMHHPSPNPDRAGFLHPDGSLQLAEWATPTATATTTATDRTHARIEIDTGPRPTNMSGTKATGQGMVTNGHLGVDLIRTPAGHGFAPHTHIGDHLLIVVAGRGTITYDGKIYETRPGQVYMVEGAVPHAVGAIDDHVLLAVGTPHRAVDAPDRQALVEYETVQSDLGDITCLICDVTAKRPDRLADLGCPHCPSRFYEDV